jgi:transcriptional regulator with XRE-family HTH domain
MGVDEKKLVWLRELRKSKGLANPQAASQLCVGLSRYTIAEWEQGRRTPDPHRLAYYESILRGLPDANAPKRRGEGRALNRALP